MTFPSCLLWPLVCQGMQWRTSPGGALGKSSMKQPPEPPTHLDWHGALHDSRTNERSHLRLPCGLNLRSQKTWNTVLTRIRSLFKASCAVLESREFHARGICPVHLMGGLLLNGWVVYQWSIWYIVVNGKEYYWTNLKGIKILPWIFLQYGYFAYWPIFKKGLQE